MPRLLICTVGTSLLTNRDDRPWAGWQRTTPLPDPAAMDRWLTGADARQREHRLPWCSPRAAAASRSGWQLTLRPGRSRAR